MHKPKEFATIFFFQIVFSSYSVLSKPRTGMRSLFESSQRSVD
jgi:hypothetical protein